MLALRMYQTHSFGDHWRAVSYALTIAARRGEPVDLYVLPEWAVRCRQIAQELQGTGVTVWADGPDVVADRLTGVTTAGFPLLPTRTKWVSVGKAIAYQFDGVFLAARKNPPPADIELFLVWCAEREYEAVNVSGHAIPAIKDAIDVLAKCQEFVGVNSGFSQMVYSVSTPATILRYQYPNWEADFEFWHTPAKRVFVDVAEFISRTE